MGAGGTFDWNGFLNFDFKISLGAYWKHALVSHIQSFNILFSCCRVCISWAKNWLFNFCLYLLTTSVLAFVYFPTSEKLQREKFCGFRTSKCLVMFIKTDAVQCLLLNTCYLFVFLKAVLLVNSVSLYFIPYW